LLYRLSYPVGYLFNIKPPAPTSSRPCPHEI
jgi:hypothetical protein